MKPEGQLGEALRGAIFSALLQATREYISCIDRQRRVLFVNRTLSRDASEIVGQPLESFLSAMDRQPAIECLEDAFSSGAMREIEYVAVLKNGTRRLLGNRFVPFRGPSGEELVLLLSEDVTERRHLAEELERSEEFRRRVVEHLPDFVSMLDHEHRFVWVNRLAPGLQWKDVIGKKLELFQSPDELPAVDAAIQSAFESGTVGQYETEGYKDGKTSAWYLVRVVPIVLEGKVDNVLLITSDVTERKRAELALRQTEEQLHRAQRLESLGQLAGGIAHDFNNLLQVIAGNISVAQQNLKRTRVPNEELEQALHATQRAAELTSQLLAIGRRKRVDSKRVELGALVEKSVRMLRHAIPENIVLQYEAPVEPCFVELDGPQFDQVLLNLFVNARDAMADGGTLTIRIQPEGTTHVTMTVSDTGAGIPPENLPRIFEPFFTTKGAGSGLGLAIAAGIVSAHGGVILTESDAKSGTTMTVRLPRPAPTDDRAPSRLRTPCRGTGVILVAEDEDMVRTQVVRILESAGYSVFSAPNGARAVDLFREHREEIELLILDVIMPELDGWQAYLRIESLAPGIKVLFTTGYAASVLPKDFAARGARLLHKPYGPELLLSQIGELLEQVGSRARTSAARVL